ncbi:predicted protein [Histoplasma capsulatum G186AR]|uniref:Uncharacterized protein n=1 Tax=Ajellomyces capsulatus (strain G186AR / H82 / ATCC MYA-2454 / RMSCC 2432) TaxID=447093 RepID=C0NG28_AJECG|nr:uncharacterized protein HCBG_01844 [Histoplasma capsulatum G186AR]EEH10199.1 predicted protein [Histoplasma capsulatum G186AR]
MPRPPNYSRDLGHFPGLPNQPKRPKTPQDCLPNHPDRLVRYCVEVVLNQVTFKDLITVVDTLQILQSTISKGPSTLLFLPSIGISSCQLGGDAGNQEFVLIVLVIILVLVFAQTTSIGLIWRPSTFLSQPDFTRAHVIDCRIYGFKIQFWKV